MSHSSIRRPTDLDIFVPDSQNSGMDTFIHLRHNILRIWACVGASRRDLFVCQLPGVLEGVANEKKSVSP